MPIKDFETLVFLGTHVVNPYKVGPMKPLQELTTGRAIMKHILPQ